MHKRRWVYTATFFNAQGSKRRDIAKKVCDPKGVNFKEGEGEREGEEEGGKEKRNGQNDGIIRFRTVFRICV